MLGVVGLGVAIYFGTSFLKPAASPRPTSNSNGETSAGGATVASPGPATSGASTPPPTTVCTATQLSLLDTSTSLTAWVSGKNTFITGKQTALTSTPTALASADPTLATTKTEIDGVKGCLDELYTKVTAASTTNANLTATQATLTRTKEQRKADIEIARDRALLALNPGYNRTNYDGWFPIDRPLRQQTIPILVGFTLFFLCMCFLSVLSLLRLDIRMLVPQLNTGAGTPLKSQAKQPLFLATMGLLVIVTGLMIWAFVRTS